MVYTKEQLEQQRNSYGASIPELVEGFECEAKDRDDPHEIITYAMQLITDSQEHMQQGRLTLAMYLSNQAKFFNDMARKKLGKSYEMIGPTWEK